MKKIGMNESCTVNVVRNKSTKLAVLFVAAGTMLIFLAPLLTEQVYAREELLGLASHITNLLLAISKGIWMLVSGLNFLYSLGMFT